MPATLPQRPTGRQPSADGRGGCPRAALPLSAALSARLKLSSVTQHQSGAVLGGLVITVGHQTHRLVLCWPSSRCDPVHMRGTGGADVQHTLCAEAALRVCAKQCRLGSCDMCCTRQIGYSATAAVTGHDLCAAWRGEYACLDRRLHRRGRRSRVAAARSRPAASCAPCDAAIAQSIQQCIARNAQELGAPYLRFTNTGRPACKQVACQGSAARRTSKGFATGACAAAVMMSAAHRAP